MGDIATMKVGDPIGIPVYNRVPNTRTGLPWSGTQVAWPDGDWLAQLRVKPWPSTDEPAATFTVDTTFAAIDNDTPETGAMLVLRLTADESRVPARLYRVDLQLVDGATFCSFELLAVADYSYVDA